MAQSPVLVRKRSFKIPLRFALIAPFVVLVTLAVALTGYLSFLNGQLAVNEVADRLRGELMARIEEHLLTFLAIPHQINQLNANAMRQGLLDPGDSDALEGHFLEQVQAFDSVTSIYFGNTAGGLVNAGREGAAGSLYVIVTDGFVSGPFKKYATDELGRRTGLLTTVPNFDARTRPWYTGAVAKGGATWSEPYILFTGQDMALAASRPVYDEQGNLLGVVSVDLFLSHLGSFMQSMEIGRTGQAFIIDQAGLLVASSIAEKPFTEPTEGQPRQRLNAGESVSPLIRDTAQALLTRFVRYDRIARAQQLEFKSNGRSFLVQVSPIQNMYGLNWLIVVVVPEADFMAHIRANNRVTIALILVALAVAILIGILTAQRVTLPIIRLNTSAQLLALGCWTQPIDEDGGFYEIGELTRSFNQMAEQLQHMLTDLTAEIVERRQTEQALRASEERLELTLQSAELGTWDWNVQTSEVIFNARWAEMLGYTLDEIEPHVRTWEKLLHPDEVPMVMSVLDDHLQGRTPIYQTEHRLRTKSGGWKWIQDTGKVLHRDEQGRALRAMGVHQDITGRKEVEESLRESNRRLQVALVELKAVQDRLVQQERLAAVGQLAAGIAHDFNNILTSILGYAELLRLSPEISESAQADLSNIITSGERAARLVRQILDFGRKSIWQPKRFDLGLLIPEITRFRLDMLPQTVHLDLKIEPGEYWVYADPVQIQQMLINLVVNARDAMPMGGKLDVVLARTQESFVCVGCNQTIEGEWICISVADTGVGILPEVLPHIFEPFFTTKGVGQGSGLGLAQVLGIVHQNDGHITVQTQSGYGTRFAIYLPPLSGAKLFEPGGGAGSFSPTL